MKKSYLITACAALLLIIFLIVVFRPAGDVTAPSREVTGKTERTTSPASALTPEDYIKKPIPIQQADLILANDPTNPEEIIQEVELLKDMTIDEKKAIEHFHTLLFALRSFNNGRMPDGVIDNVHIANALLGDHKRKIAYFTQDHPRLNTNGELIDKYGSPYDFHFTSSKDVSIRSYGPDKEPYSDDDIISNFAGEAKWEYSEDN